MNLNSNQTCLILSAQQKGLISQFSPTSIKHVIDLYKPLTHFYRNHKIESYRPRFLITAYNLLTIKREREREREKIHGKGNGNWTNNKILSLFGFTSRRKGVSAQQPIGGNLVLAGERIHWASQWRTSKIFKKYILKNK